MGENAYNGNRSTSWDRGSRKILHLASLIRLNLFGNLELSERYFDLIEISSFDAVDSTHHSDRTPHH